MKYQVYLYMLKIAEDCREKATGEINTTTLAQLAADKFNIPDALDDETHWIWEVALRAEDLTNNPLM